jgi:hypothetical protein
MQEYSLSLSQQQYHSIFSVYSGKGTLPISSYFFDQIACFEDELI